VADCGGSYDYEPGFADAYDGPTFLARTATGDPLPPGAYVAAVEIDGHRLEYPITVVSAEDAEP
jgi:hypothetical protein